jgi:hypothetical protein
VRDDSSIGSFGYGPQISKEVGVRNRRCLEASHLDPLTGSQARDSAEHRQPVIAERIDRAATETATAVHPKAVGRRLDVRAEATQAIDDGCDPVGLLVPKLLRSGNDRFAVRERAEQRDERQLVYQ